MGQSPQPPGGIEYKVVVEVVVGTVRKFKDFSVTQILREINFVETITSKNVVSAIFETLDFTHLVNFSLLKVQNS